MTIKLMPDSEELDELKETPGDPAEPATTKASPFSQKSKSPEDLLAEAKILSNLSISSQEVTSQGKEASSFNGSKSGGGGLGQAMGLFFAAVILIIISGTGGFYLGKNSSVQTVSNNSGVPATNEPAGSLQSAAEPTPTPLLEQPDAIGDEVKLTSGLTLILERAWIDSAYSKSKTALPTEAQVNVEVTFTNNESVAMSYTPSLFLLKDSKNLEYKPVAGTSGEYKPLVLGSLLPEGSVKGGISFIVPKGEKAFRLIYEDAEVIFSLSTQINTSN